jgi:5-methylthioadenosine/S-adenosylhomocysteine deaminase
MEMASRILIRRALVLIDADHSPLSNADILIDRNQIMAIAPHLTAPDAEEIDASGLLIVPGLINGHFHSHEHFHKGRYDNLPLELWMHFVRPPIAPLPLTPEQVYYRTLIGAIEAIRTGTTFVVDDVNHAPYFSPDCIEAVFRAYEDIGLRALVSVSLFDQPFHRSVPFFDEEMPEPLRQRLDRQAPPQASDLLILAEHWAEHWAETRRSERVGFIVAPSAPQRCSDRFLIQLKELADRHALPMMMHLLETRLQAITGGILYGRSMVEHLEKLGILSDRLVLQHCVWLTSEDVQRLATHGCSAVYNPLSNLKLGSGRMAVRQFLAAGVNVALASDGCGSRDSLNMLSVMQAAALLNKSPLDLPEKWLSAQEAFSLATIGGAKALGYGETLGRLAPGYRADLVGYRLASPAFTPLNHPLNQLVYAESGSAVNLVVIDGKIIMHNGKLRNVDEDQIIQKINSIHQQLLLELSRTEASVDEFLPYYRKIYERCLQESVDSAIITPDNYSDRP